MTSSDLLALVLACAMPAAALAAPVRYIHSASPGTHVGHDTQQQAFDINAWARSTLGSDTFRVTAGRLSLGFSDDADPLVDQGLLGYAGQTTTSSAFRGERDGRSGLITRRIVTTWQTRGWEDEAEEAHVTGVGLDGRARSASRQTRQDGPVVETGRQWSGWTCYWWGCSGTETIEREGEQWSFTRYDGDFGLELDLSPAALADLSQDGRWSFGVGAARGDFVWRSVRLDLWVEALPPSEVPEPAGWALAGLGLLAAAAARRVRGRT